MLKNKPMQKPGLINRCRDMCTKRLNKNYNILKIVSWNVMIVNEFSIKINYITEKFFHQLIMKYVT